jgi:hypothetical protein|tara:strand:+ start:2542 stop:2820 length:279 start_codon:yes stop_codon:yes gene_type:complete
MAVGDVVSQIAATGVVLSFQPAVGVEICVTTAQNAAAWTAITDGTSIANYWHGSHAEGGGRVGNVKIMINNSIYLYIFSSGEPGGFTGIQIK